MNAAWDFADIEHMNPPGPNQAVSPLAHLLRLGAASPELLSEAAAVLEHALDEGPTVLCFSQLPFPVRCPVRGVRVDGIYERARFELTMRKARILVDPRGGLGLSLDDSAELPAAEDTAGQGVKITQVLARVPLWGQREKHYTKYLDTVTAQGLSARIIVAANESWDRRRPMNAAQFEANLSRRLLPEFQKAVEDGLAPTDREMLERLSIRSSAFGFFIMPSPGRVCFHRPPLPTLQFVRSESDAGEGLTLFFDKRLTPFDRYLLDGVIFAVLGRDTDCRIVQFEERGMHALVHLRASRQQDLASVAEAIYRKVWEHQKQGLLRLTDALEGQAIRDGLSEMRRQLDRMTLSLQDETRAEVLPAWSWNVRDEHVDVARPSRLFVSYASEDRIYRDELETHLAVLRRRGLVETWTDQALVPGEEWDAAVKARLREADVIVCLVSSDFLASDYIAEVELRLALERHERGVARVVPILIRPCAWELSALAKFHALPPGKEPVSMFPNRDEAWVEVAHGLRRTVLALAARTSVRHGGRLPDA